MIFLKNTHTRSDAGARHKAEQVHRRKKGCVLVLSLPPKSGITLDKTLNPWGSLFTYRSKKRCDLFEPSSSVIERAEA